MHEVVPVVHALPVLQLAPCWQATHAPCPSQTMPLPHEVPAGASPFGLQTGLPPLQSAVPVWHGLLGTQAAPCWHAPQVPIEEQTLPLPQDVPAGCAPAGWQTGWPVEQSSDPVRQGSEGLQLAPCAQELQLPLPSQTWFAPHAVPGLALPVLWHEKVPFAHCRTPV